MIDYTLSNGLGIKVPQTLGELTLLQYHRCDELIKSEVFQTQTEFESSAGIVKILTDDAELSLKEFNDIVTMIGDIKFYEADKILPTNSKIYNIKSLEYTTFPNFNEINFEEFYFIKNQQMRSPSSSFTDNLILASMVRPFTKEYSDEFKRDRTILKPFNVQDAIDRLFMFDDLLMKDIYPVVNMFKMGEIELEKDFKELADRKPKDMHTGMPQASKMKIDKKWTYIAMMDALTKGDLTKQDKIMKMNILDVFYQLTYWEVRDEYFNNLNRIKTNAG